MFELKFENGLPAKEIEYVSCCQDFENNEESKNFLAELGVTPKMKVFLLKASDVEKTSGKFLGLSVVDNKLWFDYGNKYLVVNGLEADTKKFFLNENKKIAIAQWYEKSNEIELKTIYTFA